jgi:acetylornithine deacetylase
MYTACKELEASGCTNFGLLLLAGEETGSWGAKAFSKTGFEAPFLIVGEPTENKMVSASKGTLSYDLKFTGKAFHSGYPQYGVSAVELFNDFYNKLKAVDWGVDPELGETTWNIGLVHSDNPQNILAPELTCRLYFRTTFLSHQAVQKWMAPFLKEGGTQVALQSDRPEAAGDNRGQSPLGKICASARGTGDTPAHYVTLPGFESAPVAFGSDAPHLTGFGHKIICGPGSIRYAHRPDEHILVQDLENAVDIYKRLYATLLTN